MIVNPRCLDNNWLFRRERWDNLALVDGQANSIATAETEEAERVAVAWIRNHPRRPLTEWSDLADPFEPASWTDWSPVRSVRLATPGARGKAGRKKPTDTDPEYVEFLRLRRERRREQQEMVRSS